MRIDRKALPVAAPLFVAAQLERQRSALERGAAIGRAQDHTLLPTLVQIRADRQIQAIWIGRIQREALHAETAAVLMAHPVHQRQPALVARLPAVGAADIGTGVQQALLLRMKDQAADEAAAADGDIAPAVAGHVILRRRAGHQQENEQREGQAKRVHGISCRGTAVRRQEAHLGRGTKRAPVHRRNGRRTGRSRGLHQNVKRSVAA